jgi:hypothetical protein
VPSNRDRVVLRDSGIFRTRRNDAATIEQVIVGIPGKPRYYVLDGGKLERLPFAAIIRCTADAAKADKRTRSKWSPVMRYAAAYKAHSEPLDQFILRKGGINACAARFSRCVGGAPPRTTE